MNSFPVFLGACDDYHPESISLIIRKALEHIQLLKPIKGNVVIKPNLVLAHPKVATEGYTRKEVVEGLLNVIQDMGDEVDKIDVVEKAGLGVTTSSMYRYAGYKKLKKKYPINLRSMESGLKTNVVLEKGKVHRHISIAREMAEVDFLIFVPKLKTNVLSHAYSGALKLNIGTIDGKERLFHHHKDLHIKIVDILEAANPNLIVTDGIRMAYGGNQMTQKGKDLGVVVVSSNAVAHDMVCARLLNLDPFKIDHIAEAIKRGYGPSDFDQIKVMGDYPIEKGQDICKDMDFGFYPVEQFDCPFDIVSGTPYCTGGCHGIFLDWLHMIKDRKPHLLKKFPKLTVLIGKVTGPLKAKKMLLVGDCAAASHPLEYKKVTRIKGCPPSHKWIVLNMMLHYWIIAPLVLPSLIIDSFVLYPLKKIKGWIINRKFKPMRSARQERGKS